jgi:hypothetical protein
MLNVESFLRSRSVNCVVSDNFAMRDMTKRFYGYILTTRLLGCQISKINLLRLECGLLGYGTVIFYVVTNVLEQFISST